MTRIQHRRGSAAEWITDNPVLASAELGYETDTGKFKIGDGARPWNSLPYAVIDNIPDVVATGSRIVDFGYCQSELAHGSYAGFENESKVREVLQGVKDSGATRVRVAAWWKVLEPVKDAGYVWTGMDRFLGLVGEYGLEPLVCITGGTDLYPTGATVADYGQLCGALAARYGTAGRNQCHTWEIWNEANHRSYAEPFTSGGTPFGAVGYTQLLIAASTAIRAADEHAFIVSVGLMSTVDFGANDIAPDTFLQGMYDNGARGHFDAIGFHWYSGLTDFSSFIEPSTSGENYQNLLDCREIAVAENDGDIPFWVTEFGFPRGGATADPKVRALWLVEQAQMLANLPWVESWFVYQFKDSASGLAGTDSFGSVDFTLTRQQPTYDAVANVNAISPRVPRNSVGADELVTGAITGSKLAVGGTGGSGKYLAYGADGTLTAATPAGGGGGAGDVNVPLGSLYEPMDAVWPAVDATNGPLTSDAGITNTTPSFTGLTFYRWDSGKFNTQSQNWVPVPTLNGVTTNQCCQNVTTDRGNNYGGTGLPFPCHADFSFVADTAKVIVAYWVNLQGQAAQGVNTPAHEIQIFAEHEGQMKGVRDVPAFWPHTNGGGNQLMYRVLTFKQARRREFRVMLSTDAWFAGVYVDSAAQVTKAPNRPVLAVCYGDSWAEGQGNVYSFYGGNGSAAGVTWPTGCSLLYSNTAIQYAIATGFAVVIAHQGGTGYIVQNSGTVDVDDNTTTPGGFTVFGSQNSTNFVWSKWGSRSPIVIFAGGWNDGPQTTAAYKARALKVWGKQIAKDPTVPILVEGVQNRAVAASDGRDLANTGLIQAAADASMVANVIGFVNNLADANYSDIGGAGTSNIGPDTLHPTIKGGNLIGVNRAKRSATFLIPRSRVNAMLRAT